MKRVPLPLAGSVPTAGASPFTRAGIASAPAPRNPVTLPKRAAALVAGLLAVLATAAPAPAPAQSGPLRGLDGYVEQALRDWEAPGLALAVVRGDSVIYARGYGVRELGRPEPVDPNTLFAVASTTKAFTAAAIGMLVDEGRLDWDDPVTRYLPGFQLSDPYVSREMTVRDLLSHRSGLPRGDRLWWGSPFSRTEVLERVRFLEPTSSFRSQYGYQNIMFLAAGEVLPSRTGQSWDDFLAERIFAPLGMRRTGTRVRALAGMENVATPHMKHEGVVRPIAWRDFDNLGGAGAINSSAREMAQWIRLHLGRGESGGQRLVSEAVIAEMQTPQTVIPGDTAAERVYPETHFRAYGLGWSLQDYRGHKLVSHGGSLDGMRTQVAMIPEQGIGVVAITNMDGSNLQAAVAYRVLDMLLGRSPMRDWSADLRAERDRSEVRSEARRDSIRDARVSGTSPSLRPADYAGAYVHPMYGKLTVTERDGRLSARFGRAFEGPLEHWHFDTFRARWTDPQADAQFLTFRLDSRGRVDAVEMEDLGSFTRPERETDAG